jgi:hypothetical protein
MQPYVRGWHMRTCCSCAIVASLALFWAQTGASWGSSTDALFVAELRTSSLAQATLSLTAFTALSPVAPGRMTCGELGGAPPAKAAASRR